MSLIYAVESWFNVSNIVNVAHIGYFIPWVKFGDFIRAGGEVCLSLHLLNIVHWPFYSSLTPPQVIVDLVDVYAFLVNYVHSWEEVLHRTTYYRCLISAALKAVGVPLTRVRFPQSSTYQGTEQFNMDLWKLLAMCSQQDVRDTGDELANTSMMSPLMTPLLQALSEEYLDVDVQFGGKDQVRILNEAPNGSEREIKPMLTTYPLQRGLFSFEERMMPQLGCKKRIHMLNNILPSLTGSKMSSSHPGHTKIMFLDNPQSVKAKVSGAHCTEGVVEGNGILPILKHILFPVGELRSLHLGGDEGLSRLPFCFPCSPEGTLFSLHTEFDNGAFSICKHYRSYEELEQDYVAKKISPGALKKAVAEALNKLLEPIRQEYEVNEEWRESDRFGYPEDWLESPKMGSDEGFAII